MTRWRVIRRFRCVSVVGITATRIRRDRYVGGGVMSSGVRRCVAGLVDTDISKQRSTSSSRVKQVLYEQLDPKDEGIVSVRTSVSAHPKSQHTIQKT